MKKQTTFKRVGWVAALVLPLVLLGAPTSADAFDLSYLSYLLRIKYLSSLSYNLPSRDLNGIYLNDQYLDDQYIVAVSLDNVRMKHGRPASLRLNGTAFNRGGRIEGAEFTAWVDDGSELTLRVDAVEAPRRWTDSYIIRYYVSYESDEGRMPLCGTDEYGAPIAAIPLSGRWDYSAGTETGGAYIPDDRVFTFACEGYVLEKCVAAGYPPWAEVFACRNRRDCKWISLQPYHQACTRMLRADFCGNGTSYTENNVLVALYDGLGIRIDTEDWRVEAEWDEDGAVCASDGRVEELTPTCAESLTDDACGDKTHFQDGILIISELP